MTKEKWYENLPVEKLNKALEGTGWNVKSIYTAVVLQTIDLERDLRLFEHDILKYHWESLEYKELDEKIKILKKKIDDLGTEGTGETESINDLEND